MTRFQQLQAQAHAAGLSVSAYSPGDGVTRYRFCLAHASFVLRRIDFAGEPKVRFCQGSALDAIDSGVFG